MAKSMKDPEMQSDKTPFLDNDDDEYVDEYATSRIPRTGLRRRGSTYSRVAFILQMTLTILNVLVFLGWIYLFINRERLTQSSPQDRVFSAESAIHYQYQKVDTHDHHDPFTGQPGPVVDNAWSDLLKSSTIRISQAELDSMNRSSIPLEHGDGYLAYLETYHMLHCVKRIYQFQYQENYPDVIATGELTLAHWEHCLQVLRKGIMCNAGGSVNTYVRNPETGRLKGDSAAPRKCVDWSAFEAWADERTVSRQDYIETGLNGGKPSD